MTFAMPPKLDPAAIGRPSATHEHRYTWRDAALYALSVGAGPEELPYVYSRAGHEVLPSYAVIATLAACREVLQSFAGPIDGAVHRYQRVVLERPLPPEGALYTEAELFSLAGVGGVVEVRGRTRTQDSSGRAMFSTEFGVIYRGAIVEDVGDRPMRTKRPLPRRDPDLRALERTFPSQALLYAQNGDDNPIHIVPADAQRAGFARPILHGLCMFGILCRVVVANSPPGKHLRSLESEFRSPAFPGDSLALDGWYEGDELSMRMCVAERADDTVLQHVRASYTDARPAP